MFMGLNSELSSSLTQESSDELFSLVDFILLHKN